ALMAAGLVFLLIAAFVVAAREFGVVKAALGFAAVFIIGAAIIVIVHRVAARSKAKLAAKRRQSEITAVVGAAAVAMIPTLLAGGKGRSSLALLAPALAGLGWAVWRENSRGRRNLGDMRD